MTLPMRFSVCPHDTAKGIDRWALFHTLVNKQLRLGTRFLPSFDLQEFDRDLRQTGCLWAYLNPAQFIVARELHQSEALVRPIGRPDQAYLVSLRSDDAFPGPEAVVGASVAAVDGYLLRMFARSHRGFERRQAKSYAEVMTLVERGEARFGVTYNEHFAGLSSLIGERFRIVEIIDIGLSHVIAASAELPRATREALRQLLLDAPGTADGQKLLEVFGVTGFEPVPMAPYDLLAQPLP
jgi:phosphonate transport system substrate-binding protein